ncbi:hypothetical protein DRP05_12820 [Archaeoglobales archaeon]|nr:MAG: hypothetical protein DRP05_12820 [Archaeoglobales archaeon]
MIPLRIMLSEGEDQFRKYIQQVKIDSSISRPDLNQNRYSKEFSPKIEVEEKVSFESKFDLAKYLYDLFDKAGVTRKDVLKEKGLWTWLAYLWFDQLTNDLKNILKREEYYICTEPSNYRRYYLHLVASPYIIYSLFINSRYGVHISMPFLYNEVWKSNDFAEHVAPNQFIISHENLVDTIYKLYYDESKNRPKKGVTDRNKPGSIRRFVKVIRQFELTYDIYSMTSDQIIELLPSEFDFWKPKSNP